MCECARAFMRACVRAYVRVFARVHASVRTCVRTCVRVFGCVSVRARPRVHACLRAYVRAGAFYVLSVSAPLSVVHLLCSPQVGYQVKGPLSRNTYIHILDSRYKIHRLGDRRQDGSGTVPGVGCEAVVGGGLSLIHI